MQELHDHVLEYTVSRRYVTQIAPTSCLRTFGECGARTCCHFPSHLQTEDYVERVECSWPATKSAMLAHYESSRAKQKDTRTPRTSTTRILEVLYSSGQMSCMLGYTTDAYTFPFGPTCGRNSVRRIQEGGGTKGSTFNATHARRRRKHVQRADNLNNENVASRNFRDNETVRLKKKHVTCWEFHTANLRGFASLTWHSLSDRKQRSSVQFLP